MLVIKGNKKISNKKYQFRYLPATILKNNKKAWLNLKTNKQLNESYGL